MNFLADSLVRQPICLMVESEDELKSVDSHKPSEGSPPPTASGPPSAPAAPASTPSAPPKASSPAAPPPPGVTEIGMPSLSPTMTQVSI